MCYLYSFVHEVVTMCVIGCHKFACNFVCVSALITLDKLVTRGGGN